MLIVFPHTPGSGGPGSFQSRFETALQKLGWKIAYGKQSLDRKPDVVMVVGGTRKIPWLHSLRRKGIPIIYRLDGRLWLHRLNGLTKTPSRFLSSEVRNAMAQWLHGRIADSVIYQSEFVRDWWERDGWWRARNFSVIPNGIDLREYRPDPDGPSSATAAPDVVCVEGTVDYSPYAVELMNTLAEKLAEYDARLILFGGFAQPDKKRLLNPGIDYRGSVSRERIPSVYRNRIHLSLDVNPACPNAVAEALASGAPVIGFDTGAVKELVGDEAGCIVPFGGNPWKGDQPDFAALLGAYEKVAGNFAKYSRAARRRAELEYDIQQMVDAYVAVIEETVQRCRP